jgi:hypothetical protein
MPPPLALVEIAAQAAAFRATLETLDPSRLPVALQSFPRGCCGLTSDLLAVYLEQTGYGEFEYVCGERGSVPLGDWHTHAWLEGYGLIVDITADQFGAQLAPVIVAAVSPWHSAYQEQKRRRPGILEYAIAGELRSAYATIMRTMQGSST